MLENFLYTSLSLIILIALILVVMYGLSLKNIKTQKKQFKAIHEHLEIGCQVMVLNGIYGEVVKISTDIVDLKIKTGQVVEVSRYAITKIIK